jgi:hypothetical protein
MTPEFKTQEEKLAYFAAAFEELLGILLEHRVITSDQHQRIEDVAWGAMHRLTHPPE